MGKTHVHCLQIKPKPAIGKIDFMAKTHVHCLQINKPMGYVHIIKTGSSVCSPQYLGFSHLYLHHS